MEIINHGHPDYPPADVIEAARKVEQWAAQRGDGWQLSGLADRRLVFRLEAEVNGLRDAAIESGEEFDKLRTELHEARKRIRELVQQEAHWKANHDDMVQRNALLQQRPDLPVDRIPAHAELVRLRQAETNYDRLLGDLSDILHAVANELNGGPLENGWHSWHDLAHLARRQARKYRILLRRNAGLRAELAESKAANAAALAEVKRLDQEQLEMAVRLVEQQRAGTLRLNIIEDDTLEPGTMIVGDGRTQLKVTGITAGHVEAIAQSRMCEWKTEDIMQRTGMKLAGYVLQDDKGEACIIHMGAVRWLTNDQLGAVVHPQRAPDHRGMEVVAWMCPDDPDVATAFKWASKDGNAEIVPPCPTCRTARVAVWRDRIAT